MKMPPNKPVGNGYYGYEDVTYFPANSVPENVGGGTNSIESQEEHHAPAAENDFSEYLWMENEEEFEKEVMQQLEEQELMEQCLEAMLEDERANTTNSQASETTDSTEIMNLVNNFKLDLTDLAKSSTLNPLAAEFVPDARSAPPTSATP